MKSLKIPKGVIRIKTQYTLYVEMS